MWVSNDVKLIGWASPCGDVNFGQVDADVQQPRRRSQVIQLELGDIKDCATLFFYALACLGNLHFLDYKHVSFMLSVSRVVVHLQQLWCAFLHAFDLSRL